MESKMSTFSGGEQDFLTVSSKLTCEFFFKQGVFIYFPPFSVTQQCDRRGPPEAEAGTAAQSHPEVVLKCFLQPWRTCFAGKIIDGWPMNRNQPDANSDKHSGGDGGCPECLSPPGWEFLPLPEAILVFLLLCFSFWVLKDGSASVFPLGECLDCSTEERRFFFLPFLFG